MGSHSLFQRIFLTSGLNLSLLHCRQTLPPEPSGKSDYLFAQAFRSCCLGQSITWNPLPIHASPPTLVFALCYVVCFPVSRVYQPPSPMRTLTSCPSILDLLSLLCLLIHFLSFFSSWIKSPFLRHMPFLNPCKVGFTIVLIWSLMLGAAENGNQALVSQEHSARWGKPAVQRQILCDSSYGRYLE